MKPLPISVLLPIHMRDWAGFSPAAPPCSPAFSTGWAAPAPGATGICPGRRRKPRRAASTGAGTGGAFWKAASLWAVKSGLTPSPRAGPSCAEAAKRSRRTRLWKMRYVNLSTGRTGWSGSLTRPFLRTSPTRAISPATERVSGKTAGSTPTGRSGWPWPVSAGAGPTRALRF